MPTSGSRLVALDRAASVASLYFILHHERVIGSILEEILGAGQNRLGAHLDCHQPHWIYLCLVFSRVAGRFAGR